MASSAPIDEPMEVDMDIGAEPEKARTISKREWETHRQDIYRIYMEQKRPMADLVTTMERKGFKAT
jgi:hypothetical protein